jgi:hypothetical protein
MSVQIQFNTQDEANKYLALYNKNKSGGFDTMDEAKDFQMLHDKATKQQPIEPIEQKPINPILAKAQPQEEMSQYKPNIITDIKAGADRAMKLLNTGFVKGATAGLVNPRGQSFADPTKSTFGAPTNVQQLTEPFIAGAGELTGNVASGEAIGAGLKAIGETPLIKGAIQSIKNIVDPAEIAGKFRSAIWRPMVEKSKIFGSALNEAMEKNPDKMVQLENITSGLKSAIEAEKQQGFTQTSDAVKSLGGKLERYVSGDLPAKDLTLKEAQELLNEMNESLAKGVKSGISRTSSDIPKLDLVNKVKMAMSEAFPEMEGIRGQYGQTIQDFNVMKRYINPNRTLPALKSGASLGVKSGEGANAEIQEIVKRNMTPNEIREFGGYQKLYKSLSHALKIPITDIKLSPIDLIERNNINPSMVQNLAQGIGKLGVNIAKAGTYPISKTPPALQVQALQNAFELLKKKKDTNNE